VIHAGCQAASSAEPKEPSVTQHADVPPDQRKLERAIVLLLLSDNHGARCSRAELSAALGDFEPSTLAAALGHLQDCGVLLVESDMILASPCARRLDALELIGI
jgi:hypothetical protein